MSVIHLQRYLTHHMRSVSNQMMYMKVSKLFNPMKTEISSFIEEHILLPVTYEQTVKASNLHSNLLKMVF